MNPSSSASEQPRTGSSPCPTQEPLPSHIAIIMDGNGRWAKKQGQIRTFGHRQGAEVAKKITMESARMGIEALTLYSFSTENWKRPAPEIDFLMNLGRSYLEKEVRTIAESNIRFRHIGQRKGLSDTVLKSLDQLEKSTASNTGMTLALALNYGARSEITDAARSLAADAASGRIRPEDIDESLLASRLCTHGLPDPDLLIRTAGEMRLSNFLLWQISYSELFVTDVLWPDFDVTHLQQAVETYRQRQRRYGAV